MRINGKEGVVLFRVKVQDFPHPVEFLRVLEYPTVTDNAFVVAKNSKVLSRHDTLRAARSEFQYLLQDSGTILC